MVIGYEKAIVSSSPLNSKARLSRPTALPFLNPKSPYGGIAIDWYSILFYNL